MTIGRMGSRGIDGRVTIPGKSTKPNHYDGPILASPTGGGMAFTDRLKKLASKAEDEAATHKAQIHEAVVKAEQTADQRTGGQYHDEILKAGEKAHALVDDLKEPDSPTSVSAPAKSPSSDAPTERDR